MCPPAVAPGSADGAPRGSRLIAIAAAASLLYPLLVVAAIYGQWFLSWYMLGHRPEPSMGDPKYIDGASWMHGVTMVVLIGGYFAFAAVLPANILYISVFRLSPARGALRLAALLLLWSILFALLRWEPGSVFTWWAD